ncbi:MAG: sigma-70 family RNA polymerase sigma factor [Chloroflexota bacterium]|nr:sigma-70 family RNA polymerase sigma factor [Chloroflexota bacterium]
MQPDPGALEPALRAAQRGDVAAFNRLVEAYQRQVYNVCYRTLGNADDAADAAQDAFLSAFRGLRTFHGPASGFRAWMLRVAVNACYDLLRKRQRRPSDSLDALCEPGDEPPASDRLADPRPGPEQQALTGELARHIALALDQLTFEHRLTVVLCDVQGLSYEDAALVMSVELGTVKSRLSRARAHLRELLSANRELHDYVQRLQQRHP